MNSTIVANFLSSLGTSDFESWILVQQAYRDEASNEEIMETGFNTSSGYVYIALENGVQIVSRFGQDVEYCVYYFETGEELFFDTYDEAIKNLN
jgi:hypothetical protein